MNKKLAIAIAALSIGISANANAISFDPTGTGSAGSAIDVSSFDWLPGTALALNAGTAIGSGVGSSFDVFTHAALGSYVDNNGDAITGTGLNSGYEITFVAGFNEVVTGVGPGSASFAQTPGSSSSSFFDVFFDITPDSNALAGTGYNDGVKILSGQVIFSGGGFFAFPFIGNLDQFGADNYPLIDSVTGAGATLIEATIDPLGYDPMYFLTPPPVTGVDFNTSNVTPFNQTNPSAVVWNGVGYIPAASLAQVGPINGLSGPSFVFQSDSNNSFRVDEAGPLGLLGMGLLALGFARSFRRKAGNVA